MSLINDALKRADSAPAPIPATPRLTPVTEQTGGNKVWLALIVFIALVAVVGFWFLRTPAPVHAKAPVEAKKGAAPAQSALANPIQRAEAVFNKIKENNEEGSAPLVVEAPSTVPGPTQAAASEPTVSAPVREIVRTPVTQQEAALPPSGEFPELKLQAIFFRLNHPSVVLNGKTASRGDTVSGARLVSISRNSIDVEYGGVQRTLSLK